MTGQAETPAERPIITVPVTRTNGEPLLDRFGKPTVARARNGYDGYGTMPGSITRHSSKDKRFLRAEWLPTGNTAEFSGMRDANVFLYAHHDIQHGKPAGSSGRNRPNQQPRPARDVPLAD
jgi:hypothetical protein